MAEAPESTLRTFVAIGLPEEIIAVLTETQQRLQRAAERRGLLPRALSAIRWVAPEGMHLTLKFLGATPASQVPLIVERLQAELAPLAPFTLRLGGFHAFPSLHVPRVLFVEVDGDRAALFSCQAAVEAALRPLGYPSEERPYVPHLTLARVGERVGLVDKRLLGEVVSRAKPPPALPFAVESVHLMQSELHPTGARYTRLATVPLGRRVRQTDGQD